MAIYDTFQDKRTIAHNDWQRHFVLPYGSAYSTAVTNYRATIKAQEEADKAARARNLQLAFFALSLCGGSILTSVFGSAAMKDAAASVAVDVICKREMERAFKVATFVSENKTAQFALGAVWDKVESAAIDGIKGQFAENQSNFPALGKFVQEPLNMQNNLEEWVRGAYDKVLKAGSAINESHVLTADGKARQLEDLLSAPFFKHAPKQRLDEDSVRKDIELTLFMKHILDLDYLAKGYWKETGRGANMKKVVSSRTSIDMDPHSKKYPKSFRYTQGTNFEEVKYRQIGEIIEKKIDELHKDKLKHNFFETVDTYWGLSSDREDISRSVLRRAHTTLKLLGNRNLQKITSMAKA